MPLTHAQFLRAELRIGFTASKIALRADTTERQNRNRVAARKAYDALQRFRPKAILTKDQVQEIDMRTEELRAQLRLLGERV